MWVEELRHRKRPGQAHAGELYHVQRRRGTQSAWVWGPGATDRVNEGEQAQLEEVGGAKAHM